MIPAEQAPAFRALFDLYNRRYLLPRSFRRVSVSGKLDAGVARERPILYIANHSSWWDGLLLYHLWRRSGEHNHYVMMDEAQLSQYRFFRKLGAYSVDKSSPGASRASLRYTESLLGEGARVWLFPQGDIRHLESRPLELQRGAAHLLRRVPQTAVVPVTFYYTSGLHSKPEASLTVGEPIEEDWAALGGQAATQRLTDALTGQLDRHRARVIAATDNPGGAEGFDVELLRTGLSVNEKYDRFRRKRRTVH